MIHNKTVFRKLKVIASGIIVIRAVTGPIFAFFS